MNFLYQRSYRGPDKRSFSIGRGLPLITVLCADGGLPAPLRESRASPSQRRMLAPAWA